MSKPQYGQLALLPEFQNTCALFCLPVVVGAAFAVVFGGHLDPPDCTTLNTQRCNGEKTGTKR